MKYHVGVFSYYYLPIVNGVTLTIADWMRHAKRSGIQSTIFIPNLGSDVYRGVADVVPYPAVPLYRRLGITIPMFPETYVLREVLQRKIDLLHAHHPFYIGNLALTVKKQYKLPLVFTYHTRYSDYVASYMPALSPHMVQALTIKFLLRFLNQCDAITVSNTALKY
ncbi:MAG: Glycosyl transferase group 1, partial [Microgenomates group bacterium GW2011_GWC1_49_7]